MFPRMGNYHLFGQPIPVFDRTLAEKCIPYTHSKATHPHFKIIPCPILAELAKNFVLLVIL